MSCRTTILIAALGLAACMSPAPAAQFATMDSVSIAEPAGAAQAAKDAVTRILRDPDSAKFGPVMFYQEPTGQIFACGSVNARNGFGGYAGDARFYAVLARTGSAWAAEAQIQDISDAGGIYGFNVTLPRCASE